MNETQSITSKETISKILCEQKFNNETKNFESTSIQRTLPADFNEGNGVKYVIFSVKRVT